MRLFQNTIVFMLTSVLILVSCTTSSSSTKSSTEVPSPTPDIKATVEALVAAALEDMETPTESPSMPMTPTPTSTVAPTPTPNPSPTPTFTPTPPKPQPTQTPTSTPIPTAPTAPPVTSEPSVSSNPELSLAEVVSLVRPSIVKIKTNIASGSGFFIDTDSSNNQGQVLTNYHVIEDASTINIIVNDSENYEGIVVGTDPLRDLALINICCNPDFKKLTFAKSEQIVSGEDVVAIGYPLGRETAVVTKGIISASYFQDEEKRWVIQTDAPINPGNSGGPLLLLTGEVLGVTTFKSIYSADGVPVEGVGFAVSEKTITSILPELKETSSAATTIIESPSVDAPSLYTNEKSWYTIEVPSGWKVQEYQDSEIVMIVHEASGAHVRVVATELDSKRFQTLEQHVLEYRATPSSSMTDFKTLNETWQIGNPNLINRHTTTNRWKWAKDTTGTWQIGVWDRYLLGKNLITVMATGPKYIYESKPNDDSPYFKIKSAMYKSQNSFQPVSHTNTEVGYSLVIPSDWTIKPTFNNLDFVAKGPGESDLLYVQTAPRAGHNDIFTYGSSAYIQNRNVFLTSIVFDLRPAPSFRMDYTTTNSGLRGAALVTFTKEYAVWVFIEADKDNWKEISPTVDDIFLRVSSELNYKT